MKSHPSRPPSRVIPVLAAIALLGASARATEYFVDAVHGSNANSGTSPGTAWRTITHALSQLPVPSTGIIDVVHVAPGTYDAALGEVFPLRLMGHDAVQIVGDAGPQATILDGGGASSVIFSWPDAQVFNFGTGPDTLVAGLTLTNATDGVVLGANKFRSTYLTCRDLIVTQMSGRGLSANAGFTMAPQIQLWVTFERVAIRNCREGVFVTTPAPSSSTFSHANVSLVESAISNCIERGVVVSDVGFDSNGSSLALRRCRIVDNGLDGVRVDQGSSAAHTTSCEIQDCLVARNGGAGVNVTVPPGMHNALLTAVRRCTIADNAGVGLDSFYTPFGGFPEVIQTTLSASILYGNADDVNDNPAYPTIQNPSFNDIGDGDYAGSNGNIALNPLFRDAPSGDYRLVWGGPCVDRGEPGAFPIDALDLQGAQRDIDGDLDVARRSDIGAFEFTPLWAVTAPHVGGPMALEMWGPTGGTSNLLVVRGGLLAAPVSTPFGDLFLNASGIRNLGLRPVASGPPAVRLLAVPNQPIFAGVRFSFQALTTSTVGVPPSAYTNAISVTILP